MNVIHHRMPSNADFQAAVKMLLSPDAVELDVADCVSDFVRRLGFDYFSYAIAPTVGYNGTSGIILTDYSVSWLQKYRSGHYHDGDPLLAECRGRSVPFGWGGRDYLERLDTYPRSLLLEAMDFGIAEGFTIPIRGTSGELGVFSGVYAALSDGDALRWKPGYEWLTSLAPFVHAFAIAHIDRKTMSGDAVILSEHERTCLSWTLKGKTSWEIAQIIGRSRPTVEYHFQKAMRKLDATNKAHAAALAMKRGLM